MEYLRYIRILIFFIVLILFLSWYKYLYFQFMENIYLSTLEKCNPFDYKKIFFTDNNLNILSDYLKFDPSIDLGLNNYSQRHFSSYTRLLLLFTLILKFNGYFPFESYWFYTEIPFEVLRYFDKINMPPYDENSYFAGLLSELPWKSRLALMRHYLPLSSVDEVDMELWYNSYLLKDLKTKLDKNFFFAMCFENIVNVDRMTYIYTHFYSKFLDRHFSWIYLVVFGTPNFIMPELSTLNVDFNSPSLLMLLREICYFNLKITYQLYVSTDDVFLKHTYRLMYYSLYNAAIKVYYLPELQIPFGFVFPIMPAELQEWLNLRNSVFLKFLKDCNLFSDTFDLYYKVLEVKYSNLSECSSQDLKELQEIRLKTEEYLIKVDYIYKLSLNEEYLLDPLIVESIEDTRNHLLLINELLTRYFNVYV